jgi:hypothetical protein
MKKFLILAALTLATPIITQHSETLALTLGSLPRDVIYSPDGIFNRSNIFFNNPTDTIQISGQTWLGNESTYEALTYFPRGIGANGLVFNEYKFGLEDKVLSAGPNGFLGYNYPNFPNPRLSAITSTEMLVPDAWHHIAFVQGGGTQRLYLDGQIFASRPSAGDIWDSDGGGFLGANHREIPLQAGRGFQFAPSFIGHLDTLRISNMARYSGNSFEAPTGDLASDANTQIVYNFNLEDYFQQDGFTWVSNLSSNGRNGRFGTGFADATSPSIVVPVEAERVPEPSSTLGLLAVGAFSVRVVLKHKRKRKF